MGKAGTNSQSAGIRSTPAAGMCIERASGGLELMRSNVTWASTASSRVLVVMFTIAGTPLFPLLARGEEGAAAATQNDWTLRPTCDPGCTPYHVSGGVYEPTGPVVATPEGSTYSVSHRVGVDPDDEGPDPETCVFIFHLNLPGAPDDIVTFDGLTEPLRTDFFLTVPTVTESQTIQPSGTRFLTIDTRSPTGTDLFPGGIQSGGMFLTDACFTIGLDDPLTWEGLDTVTSAFIEFRQDTNVLLGPINITSFFSVPWNGFLSLSLPNGAGMGINGVHLEIVLVKSVEVQNDDCRDQIEVTNGLHPFSTIGATTDGPDEGQPCRFSLFSQIDADIWYRYTATCTGEVRVDLCDSEFDTKLAVYDACRQCPPSEGSLAGCNDDFCGTRSVVTVPVTLDDCLTIRLGGYLGAQGDGVMEISCADLMPTGACCATGVCFGTFTEDDCQVQDGTWYAGETCPAFTCPFNPPPNDECDDCIPLLTNTPFTASSVDATGVSSSGCSIGDMADVWHCWTADCTGLATIRTCGSNYDTTLAVYDACNGTQLDCDDDHCAPLQSVVSLAVVSGTTYYFRVAGFRNAAGNYTITVDPCANACCAPSAPNGGCILVPPAQCIAGGGTPLDPGRVCLGDGNDNGINDACEACPEATIANTIPADGTLDARQPSLPGSLLPRQGIGAPGQPGAVAEPIVIQLSRRLGGAQGCFDVCETVPDPILGANSINTVTHLGSGVYQISLHHAIAQGGVTTIYYDDGSFVEFTSHPANVDGNTEANPEDLLKLGDCCLRGLCTPPGGNYSCDLDRSGLVSPIDSLTGVDLLNGLGVWAPWNFTPRPADASCP